MTKEQLEIAVKVKKQLEEAEYLQRELNRITTGKSGDYQLRDFRLSCGNSVKIPVECLETILNIAKASNNSKITALQKQFDKI